MNARELHHDDPHAVTWNGHQNGNCQGQTDAVAPGGIREHLAMITSAGEMGKQLREWQTFAFLQKSEVWPQNLFNYP
jgi:hypothetical protein